MGNSDSKQRFSHDNIRYDHGSVSNIDSDSNIDSIDINNQTHVTFYYLNKDGTFVNKIKCENHHEIVINYTILDWIWYAYHRCVNGLPIAFNVVKLDCIANINHNLRDILNSTPNITNKYSGIIVIKNGFVYSRIYFITNGISQACLNINKLDNDILWRFMYTIPKSALGQHTTAEFSCPQEILERITISCNNGFYSQNNFKNQRKTCFINSKVSYKQVWHKPTGSYNIKFTCFDWIWYAYNQCMKNLPISTAVFTLTCINEIQHNLRDILISAPTFDNKKIILSVNYSGIVIVKQNLIFNYIYFITNGKSQVKLKVDNDTNELLWMFLYPDGNKKYLSFPDNILDKICKTLE